MKIDIDIDLAQIDEAPTKDGQIAVKISKDQELRFKVLNARHNKRLNGYIRDFAIKLMDVIEKKEAS